MLDDRGKSEARTSALTDLSLFQEAAEFYKRPTEATESLKSSYAKISKLKLKAAYEYTGTAEYSFLFGKTGLYSNSKLIMSEMTKTRKLCVLDLGAGDFSFSSVTQQEFAEKVSCYGIIAEAYPKEDEYHRVGNAEFLSDYFPPNYFDLIFSEKTFMHFVDPIGSLIEAYETLKPGGILIVDRVSIPGCESYITHLIAALTEAGYLCLGEFNSHSRCLSNFIIQKTKELPSLRFPVLFHSFGKDKFNDERVYYKPTLRALSGNNLRAKRYQEGIELILKELNAHYDLPKVLTEYTSLQELFSNAAYQNLPNDLQYLLILATTSNSKLKLLQQDGTKEEKEPMTSPQEKPEAWSILKKGIDSGHGLELIFYLVTCPEFRTLSNDQQCDLLMLAAEETILRRAAYSHHEKLLDLMKLPFEKGSYFSYERTADLSFPGYTASSSAMILGR